MQYQRDFYGIQRRSMECKEGYPGIPRSFYAIEEAFSWNTQELAQIQAVYNDKKRLNEYGKISQVQSL